MERYEKLLAEVLTADVNIPAILVGRSLRLHLLCDCGWNWHR